MENKIHLTETAKNKIPKGIEELLSIIIKRYYGGNFLEKKY